MRSWRDAAFAALAIAAPLMLAACYGGGPATPLTPAEDGADAATPTQEGVTSLADRPCPPGSPLTYDNFGDPFFMTWCTGCHSASLATASRENAPTAVNFNTLDEVRQYAPRIWARAADTNATMPPAGGPHPDERTFLGDWLACGAP